MSNTILSGYAHVLELEVKLDAWRYYNLNGTLIKISAYVKRPNERLGRIFDKVQKMREKKKDVSLYQ